MITRIGTSPVPVSSFTADLGAPWPCIQEQHRVLQGLAFCENKASRFAQIMKQILCPCFARTLSFHSQHVGGALSANRISNGTRRSYWVTIKVIHITENQVDKKTDHNEDTGVRWWVISSNIPTGYKTFVPTAQGTAT